VIRLCPRPMVRRALRTTPAPRVRRVRRSPPGCASLAVRSVSWSADLWTTQRPGRWISCSDGCS